jgi:hypothetical protein
MSTITRKSTLESIARTLEAAQQARGADGFSFDEIAYYEAWLYEPANDNGDPDRLPDHYILSHTRDEMLAALERVPGAQSLDIVVKAMARGRLCPVDPYGNALDPVELTVIANAV